MNRALRRKQKANIERIVFEHASRVVKLKDSYAKSIEEFENITETEHPLEKEIAKKKAERLLLQLEKVAGEYEAMLSTHSRMTILGKENREAASEVLSKLNTSPHASSNVS